MPDIARTSFAVTRAPLVGMPLPAGAQVVVSQSYARIFFRNCIATGEMYPCETDVRLCDELRTGAACAARGLCADACVCRCVHGWTGYTPRGSPSWCMRARRRLPWDCCCCVADGGLRDHQGVQLAGAAGGPNFIFFAGGKQSGAWSGSNCV